MDREEQFTHTLAQLKTMSVRADVAKLVRHYLRRLPWR